MGIAISTKHTYFLKIALELPLHWITCMQRYCYLTAHILFQHSYQIIVFTYHLLIYCVPHREFMTNAFSLEGTYTFITFVEIPKFQQS